MSYTVQTYMKLISRHRTLSAAIGRAVLYAATGQTVWVFHNDDKIFVVEDSRILFSALTQKNT